VCKTLKESGNDNFSLKFLLGEVVDWQEFEFNWDYLVDVLEEQAIKADFVREIQSGCTCTNLRTDLSLSDGSCAIETLAFALQRFHPRGIQASTQVDGNMLLAQLRAAFDLSSLETDRMYWEMRTWQRKFRYALLKQWRTLDPLNVVLDQRYWEQDLKALVSLMNPDNVLVAFKLDLDNFKDVNTQLGHSGGDEAIRVYCQTVLDTIGDVAEVYRRGGDEVVAFAPDLTPEHGIVLAEQLRCSIERNLGHWGKSKGLVSPPTASIGVLAISGDQPIPTITSALDAVQQRAKDEGKNRFTFESIGRLAPS
jgi:diguanylate cyclase (GGDEF)-like protein